MNFDNCKIYRRKKLIGILPCKLIKKTKMRDEHLLIRNSYNIKPGYVIIFNDAEKFYVKDVRTSSSNKTHIEVYFKTNAQHKEKIIEFWIPVIISILALIIAAIFVVLIHKL